ncbi:hypothetical protein K488DRAFT_90431 [Vararia minispora EC-137]|uniref:Uncharacterized protein n=1 Tax=Vararia minispora EC-137 TaxID=1314806 RepID=A0ACB8Q869_9AGAM|nr:hypothetical protein K488DRAFT_90431 [Vararia minispora EC-137]
MSIHASKVTEEHISVSAASQQALPEEPVGDVPLLPDFDELWKLRPFLCDSSQKRVLAWLVMVYWEQSLGTTCIGLKVPTWPRGNVSGGWEIDGLSALKAVTGALPQIVQQAQFIFNTCPTLSCLWACGVAGRWAVFYRFDRATTPGVDVNNLSKDHGYFHSAPDKDGGPTKYAKDIPVFQTQSIAIVDSDGHYTEKFKSHWHLAISTSAAQWDDKEPRDAAAARKYFGDLKVQIVGSESSPTSRRPSQAEIEVQAEVNTSQIIPIH